MALRRAGWDVGRADWKELFALEPLVRRVAALFPLGAVEALISMATTRRSRFSTMRSISCSLRLWWSSRRRS